VWQGVLVNASRSRPRCSDVRDGSMWEGRRVSDDSAFVLQSKGRCDPLRHEEEEE